MLCLHMIAVRLEKLRETENPYAPNNIETGFVKEGELMDVPVVGEPFWVGRSFRTSIVQEIIDAHTFRTFNSVYRWTAKQEWESTIPELLERISGKFDPYFGYSRSDSVREASTRNDLVGKLFWVVGDFLYTMGENMLPTPVASPHLQVRTH